MNPLQKNKVDIKSLTPEEQRIFRMFGKLPSKSDQFKHLKERKYFDSGDYAMSKAGKGDSLDTGEVGCEHPVPEVIRHLASPNGSHNAVNTANGGANAGAGGAAACNHQHHHHQPTPGHVLQTNSATGSPIKESSFLNRETTADGESVTQGGEETRQEGQDGQQQMTAGTGATDAAQAQSVLTHR